MARGRKTSVGALPIGHYVLVACIGLGALVVGRSAAAETLVGTAASVTTKSRGASHAALGLFAGWNSAAGPAIQTWYGFAPGKDAKAHDLVGEAVYTTPLRGMGIALRPYLGGGIEFRTDSRVGQGESSSAVQAIVGAGSLWYLPKHSVLTVAVHYGFERRSVTARVAISRRF